MGVKCHRRMVEDLEVDHRRYVSTLEYSSMCFGQKVGKIQGRRRHKSLLSFRKQWR